jgi:hypothetical protein
MTRLDSKLHANIFWPECHLRDLPMCFIPDVSDISLDAIAPIC